MNDAAVLETIGNGERKISVSGIWYMYSKSWFIDFLRLCSNVNSHFTLQIFLAGSEYGQSFFKRGGKYFVWWPICYTGGGLLEKGIFFRLQVYERVGISLKLKYLKRWENLWFGLWKGPKGLTDEFYGFIKTRKRSVFVIDPYLNDSAFTAVKRGAKFWTRYVKGVPFVNRRYSKGYLVREKW